MKLRMFLVSGDLDEIFGLATRILVLSEGRMVHGGGA
jgi:ABC-type uncharacterized transport system ATPase subunit